MRDIRASVEVGAIGAAGMGVVGGDLTHRHRERAGAQARCDGTPANRGTGRC